MNTPLLTLILLFAITHNAISATYSLKDIDNQLVFDGQFDGRGEQNRSRYLAPNNGWELGLYGKWNYTDISYSRSTNVYSITSFTPSFHRLGGDVNVLLHVPGGGLGYQLKIQSGNDLKWYSVFSEKWSGLPGNAGGTIVDTWSSWPSGHRPFAVHFLCMAPDYVEAEPGRDLIRITADLNIVSNTNDPSALFPRVSTISECILTYTPKPSSISVSIPNNNSHIVCPVGRPCEIDNTIIISGDTNVTVRVRATHTDGLAAVAWGTTPPVAPSDTLTTEIPVGSVVHNLRVGLLDTTAPGNATVNVNILAEIT